MAEAIQLNLFGDLLNDDSNQQPEVDNYAPTQKQLGPDGGDPLEKVPSKNVPETSGGRDPGPGADKGGISDNGGNRDIDRTGPSAGGSGGDSSPTVHLPDTRITEPGTLRNGHTDDRGNYHITSDDRIGIGGKVLKFEDNLAAITLLKKLESEKRYALPEEQSILVKYTGWGGLQEAFKENHTGPWADRHKKLKETLSPDEYRSASLSTINAHYSMPDVASAVWDGVTRLGYAGGPTMEPGLGIGHFYGTRPTNLPIEMHGIELDSISGRIAQQLYQSANIKIAGYETIPLEKDRYNLFIGNVPFADIKPYEDKNVQTPGLDNRYSLHDFYFLKSLYGTRPGGLTAFITSRYTLDKENPEVRAKIAESADFIGAIRLPNNTFSEIANTEVVTDIVFLQKRHENQPMSELTKQFINTGSISLNPPDGTGPVVIPINQYYIDHPEMILGKSELTGTMYRGNEYTVSLTDRELSPLLRSAIQKLPENIMSVIVDSKTTEISTPAPLDHIDPDKILRGAFVVGQDTRLYQKTISNGKLELSPLYKNEEINRGDIVRTMQMVTMKDCVKKAIDHYYHGQQMEMHAELSRLNALYDNYILENGFLNAKRNSNLISDDPDSSILFSLEHWDPKTKTGKKADIFEGISLQRKAHVSHVDSPVDAMSLSLSRYGNLNLQYMESLTGTERNDLLRNLSSSGHIFQDPFEYLIHQRSAFYTADEYLSGNIREKIRQAEQAAVKEPLIFTRNITALQQVMPKDLGPQDISIRLNSPILGEKHVADFVRDILIADNISVTHFSINGKWEIRAFCDRTADSAKYGTPFMSGLEIINTVMNGKPLRVYDKDSDGNPVLNQDKTNQAEMKAEEIKNQFMTWVWKDSDRANDIVKRYNEVYNSFVERIFTHPERITNPEAKVFFHGCNFPYPMRSHQADAIWREIQCNNNMLAHTVGAGKTLEMAISAMEQRRLGLRSKPMIVCPDHMIGQWATEFRAAYPNAKLLVADDENWDQKNRRSFINKIAMGDWDTIIIRSESFKMIPMSLEFQKKFFDQKIAEYHSILSSCDAMQKRSRSFKDLQKALEKYKNKVKELTDAHRDEGVLPFDKLGIDQLYIDEADRFKNLEYYTQLQNVRGLGDPKGSERAIDMLMKIRYVQENDGGVTFATGTPISNTLVEAYTMQRFLQPDELKRNGLEAFDEWARQYAETVTQMELNNTGTGYRPVTRFSKIVNVPELVSSLKKSWDIQTAQSLEKAGILVPGINLPHMLVINEAAPSTPLLQSYQKHLEIREIELKGKKPEPGSDNVLSIMTDGRKAAVDLRLINPNLPDDPNSKLNVAVRRIFEIYNRTQSDGYSQAVFFDRSRSFAGETCLFDGVNDMKKKLIELGVKPSEIGDVRQCKTSESRRELFQRVNEGKCRIIFGSTENMGAGTNYQEKLKAIHNLDAPWRPRDIEQRNGRGYRPGNKTGELEVYNYVTKGSLDTGLWNVLETKAASIRQIMDGSDKSSREIAEDYFGSVKDLSIDNPLMKEAVELSHSINKLKSMERGHHSEVANANNVLHNIPRDVSQATLSIEKIKADMSLRSPEAKGDAFSITIDGKKFTERKDAGELLLKKTATLELQARSANKNLEDKIGQYAGYPIIIRTMLEESFAKARIYVQGKNFRYGADIRNDSIAVGLLRSFHDQIYKTPEKLIAENERIIISCNSKIGEYQKIADSSFAKKTELTEKEIRYSQVMEILKKESEEKSKNSGDNTLAFPWHSLDSMSPSKISSYVEGFLDRNPFLPEQKSPESSFPHVSNAADIQKAVENILSFKLPPMTLSALDKGISEQSIKPDIALQIIVATIEESKARGYSWNNSTLPDVHSTYSKDKTELSQGDFIIKHAPDSTPAQPMYEAYRLIDSTNTKYLGSESEVNFLKMRVEHYSTALEVNTKINETIALSTENKKEPPAVKEPSKGLDI